MLKYFSVENFKSIKDKAILEFDTGLEENSVYGAQPVIGIAGANASGKTALLQAISFTLWFMQHSFLTRGEDEPIPCIPFHQLQNQPSQFHLVFSHRILVEGKEQLTDFEYSVCLSEKKVIEEELAYSLNGEKQEVYLRKGNHVEFGRTISKLEPDSLRNLRDNSSIVSFAAQFTSQTIATSCQTYPNTYNVHSAGLHEPGLTSDLVDRFLRDSDLESKLVDFLQVADLGITGIYKEPDEVIYLEDLEERINKFKNLNEDLQQQTHQQILDFLRAFRLAKIEAFEVEWGLKHKIDNEVVNFPLDQESTGTKQFLVLLTSVIPTLQSGRVLILDELEVKLHQNLVAYLIGLFQNQEQNPKGAQLIFSFHNTYLMEILSPEQLWFTEKNDRGGTEVFSAADFEDIADLHQKSLERLYRIGRFGAKPRGL